MNDSCKTDSRKIVVATRNRHKLKEIQALLDGCGMNAVSLDAFPRAPKVVEDGATFAANAAKKARMIARFTGRLTLADDSGLCVDALDGAPGVISARFSGPGATDHKNNTKLLRLLRDVPASRRTARFVCTIAIADRRGIVGIAEGMHRGKIVFFEKGTNGFGYDPLFYSPRLKKTFAQLTGVAKNSVSHRGRALAKARKIIFAYLRTSRRACRGKA